MGNACTCKKTDGSVPAKGKDCPKNNAEKCVAPTTTTTTTTATTATTASTPAPLAELTAAAKKGDTTLQVDTQGTLGVGDIIILNIGQSTEETLTVAGFRSILVKEPLKYDHEAGETITLKNKADIKDTTTTVVVGVGEGEEDSR